MLKPWKPGQSGNPNGRPPIPQDVRDAARALTIEAIEALRKALADPRSRVAASVALLDRGWGKPNQTIEEVTATLGTPEEIAARMVATVLEAILPILQQHRVPAEAEQAIRAAMMAKFGLNHPDAAQPASQSDGSPVH